MELDPDFYADPKDFSAIPYVVHTLRRSAERRNAQARRVSELTAGVDDLERLAFEKDFEQVQTEVDRLVERNFEGFTSSARKFSSIVREFTEAQDKVRKLKQYVLHSQNTLVSRKRNLKDLWFQQVQQEKALELISEVEIVAEAPARLDKLLQDEAYVACVDLFQKAYALAFGPNLNAIPALADVQRELFSYRERIYDILIGNLLQFLGKYSQDDFDEDSAIIALDSIVISLSKMQRLQPAIYRIKSSMRDLLSDRIEHHMQSARKFKAPHGMSISLSKIDDVRLQQFFEELLLDFKNIFKRHLQFSRILEGEAPEIAKSDYSLDEAWSTIQVEIQQLLELHLTMQSSYSSFSSSSGSASDEKAEIADSILANSRLNFNGLRAATLEITRPAHRQREEVAFGRRPICNPSPYRLLVLVENLVAFSSFGEELAGMVARQLIAYLKEFVANVLVPQLQLDGLNNLQGSTTVAFELTKTAEVCACRTNIGTTLCRELFKVAFCAESLQLISCDLEDVVQDLFNFFVEFIASEVSKVIEGKKCDAWMQSMRETMREDPLFASMIQPRGKESRENVKKAMLEYMSVELEKENSLIKREVHCEGQVLNQYEVSRLAAINATCDLLVKSLLLQEGRDSESVYIERMLTRGSTIGVSRMDPSFLERMAKKEMQAIFNKKNSKVRGYLNDLATIAEQTIFSVKCELRVRCIASLEGLQEDLSKAGLAKDNNSTKEPTNTASSLAHDLVLCARSIEGTLSATPRSYVLHALCSLISRCVLQNLESYHMRASKVRDTGVKLSAEQLQVLVKALSILQQTMWTILLASEESEDFQMRTRLNRNVQKAKDQLLAFDAAQRFLKSFEVTPDSMELQQLFEIASENLSLSVSHLKLLRELFVGRK